MDQTEKELFFIDHILVHEKAVRKVLWVGKAAQNARVHEDLMQNTMLKAWQGLDQIKDTEKIKSWLYQIARNEVKMYLREQEQFCSVHTPPLEVSNPFANDSIAVHYSEDCLDHTIRNFETQVAIRTLDELDEDSRQLVILHYIQGYSLNDIATLLSIKIGTITSKLARAAKKFRMTYYIHMGLDKVEETQPMQSGR